MEIELKYDVRDKKVIEEIKKDKELAKYFIKDSEEKIDLEATYFDTEEGILYKNFVALRLRREGKRNIATLKWNGTQEDCLHMREELNVNLGFGDFCGIPDIKVFKQSEIGEKIIEIVGDKSLVSIIEVNVQRESWQMEKANNIFEFSFDVGYVITDNGKEPISELEVELITGDEEKLMELGKQLSAKYNLEAESRSKFKKGLELLGI